jgi:uncharacterized protein YlxW (UPF0749 family)
MSPRMSRRGQVLVGLMAAILGFALAVQLRSSHQTSGFASARQEDLVRILDDLSARGERLRQEIEDLEHTRDRLTGGAGQSEAALAESRRRQDVLRILAGTVAAAGPGIEFTIRDPERSVTSEVLLNTVQELRDAGAEAIAVNGTARVVAQTYFLDDEGAIVIGGREVKRPFVIEAIGDPDTMSEAVRFRGGLLDRVANVGGKATVVERDKVTITALADVKGPEYARPRS